MPSQSGHLCGHREAFFPLGNSINDAEVPVVSHNPRNPRAGHEMPVRGVSGLRLAGWFLQPPGAGKRLTPRGQVALLCQVLYA